MLDADALRSLMDEPGILGLGEMMDFPAVCAGEPEVLAKLEAFSGRMIDGHAPLLSGGALQAYRLAGSIPIMNAPMGRKHWKSCGPDSPCWCGRGSAAHNLETILTAVKEAGLGYDRLAFCTDDKHIEDIRRDGHIRHNIREAIRLGVPAAEAYRMAKLERRTDLWTAGLRRGRRGISRRSGFAGRRGRGHGAGGLYRRRLPLGEGRQMR